MLLEEQGRHQFGDVPDGAADDYELFLADQGFPGREYASGMTQNEFVTRSWHLPEHCHPVNWAAESMCRVIRRRDPRRPDFWYLSFSAPHPPVTPLAAYMDLYRDADLEEPAKGNWSEKFENLPYHIQKLSNPDILSMARAGKHERDLSRRGFYATVTQIDHQIRVVIGYLRECGLLDNTIIAFTSDHGHMVGEHGEGEQAMRMIRRGRHKLIYYPVGNRYQLFDIEADPRECSDLASEAGSANTLEELKALLQQNFYGDDTRWVRGQDIVGLPARSYEPAPDRNLRNQRGLRYL